jgi:hypothetical protein
LKKILKLSGILSWFNLVLWGLVISLGVLGALALQSFALVVICFLLSVIILHSYAALQLHKSIRNPSLPLSNQTPVGIRLIGFVALFFGIAFVINGFALASNTREIVQYAQTQMPQMKTIPAGTLVNAARVEGIFVFLCGLSIALNVFLNFRLLRWYFFMKGMV